MQKILIKYGKEFKTIIKLKQGLDKIQNLLGSRIECEISFCNKLSIKIYVF